MFDILVGVLIEIVGRLWSIGDGVPLMKVEGLGLNSLLVVADPRVGAPALKVVVLHRFLCGQVQRLKGRPHGLNWNGFEDVMPSAAGDSKSTEDCGAHLLEFFLWMIVKDKRSLTRHRPAKWPYRCRWPGRGRWWLHSRNRCLEDSSHRHRWPPPGGNGCESSSCSATQGEQPTKMKWRLVNCGSIWKAKLKAQTIFILSFGLRSFKIACKCFWISENTVL